MAPFPLTATPILAMWRPLTTYPVRGILAGAGAAAGGAAMLACFPRLETELFAGGAARLASWFSGVAAVRLDEGWALAFSGQPVIVTTACNATDFFLMTAALLGWHCARRMRLPVAVVAALGAAVPLTLFINALRIVAVAQAHRWIIPRMPAAYGSFLHMLTGVAVFLPALIALNLILEFHGRSRNNSARA